MAARVVQRKVEARCRICRSSARDAVNVWIARRGEKDEAGATITWASLRANVLPVLMPNDVPSTSALKRHLLNGHIEVVADGDEGAEATGDGADLDPDELLAQVDQLLEGGFVSATGLLDLQLRAYLLDLRRRIANGERLPLSHDQAARAADRLIQAERRAGEAQLLGALGGAIGSIFSGRLLAGELDGEEIAGELEGPVEDAEFEKVGDDV